MQGQWIGNYAGTNNGLLVVELDDRGDHFGGNAVAYNQDLSAPALICFLQVPKGESAFNLTVDLNALERGTGLHYTEENFKKKFPNLNPAKTAETKWVVQPSKISITWKTDIETNGQAELLPSEGGKNSTLSASDTIKNWASFRDAIFSETTHKSYLFRGQENSRWKLRTSFHRSNRADLLNYMSNDIANLHRHLSGLTVHRFNLRDDLDYASFLSLVQHHGYPTPLLDWTASPFIAAYFAYNNLSREEVESDQRVRIHIFNADGWNKKFERAGVIAPGFLHLTVLAPLAINNPRAVPQQAMSTVTNVDDLEKYISEREQLIGKTYLAAIDLPANERNIVMRELDLMGINAGSLFPGLDGACKQLREQNFPPA